MLIVFRFAISREIFASKAEFSKCGGRWKLGIVPLQAGGSHKMWIDFFIVKDLNVSPGQMCVTVVVIAEDGVVNIQMLGASWDGILPSWVFLICNEHLAEMLCVFLVYRAVMQDGRFMISWKGAKTLQNCPICFLTNIESMRWHLYHHCFILSDTKVLSVDVITCCKVSM